MNNSTIDHLLTQVQVLNRIKSSGLLGGQLLTQSGLDMCNEELSTIEAELDTRKPEGDFVALLGNNGLPVGFEPKVDSFAIRPSDIQPLVCDWQEASIDWTLKRVQRKDKGE